MTAHDAKPPPNPLNASDPASFVQLLRELYQWAGTPVYRKLERLGGKRRGKDGGEVPQLPVSTTHRMLNTPRPTTLPPLERVEAFVRTCFQVRSPSSVEAEVGHWVATWWRLNDAKQGIASTVRQRKVPAAPDAPQRDPGEGRRPPPRQLPPRVPDFVGRSQELDVLTARLDGAESANTMVITSVGGTPGVGKTAFALWWAHQVEHRFPDGNLYVDLRGYGPGNRRSPASVLGLFLEALGEPGGKLPAEEDARVGRYRSLVAGRKMLVVLDNAATAEDVRPLLPGTPGCVVVVTSRSTLAALIARDGARSVRLGPLSQDEAVELLRCILGGDRIEREPEAAAAIARSCAYLPLALRVAAYRALLQSDLPLAEIIAELARRRLDVLSTPDSDPYTDMRTVLSWSYDALPEPQARLFLLVGLHPGPEISVPAAAALADIETTAAHRLLEALAAVHLLERAGSGRYRFHDLLREYAAERADADLAEGQRATALRRVLDWYLHTAFAGYHVLMAHLRPVPLDPLGWACPTLKFSTVCEAMGWFEAERANLVAAVERAAQCEEHTRAWKIAAAASGYFQIRKPWDDWIATCKVALSSARQVGDKHGQCWSLSSLGIAYWGLGNYDEAHECHQSAVTLCQEIGDRWGEGILLSFLGDVYRSRGQLDDAVRCYRDSRKICGGIDERWGRWGAGFALHNLGNAYRDMGRPDEAITCYEKTLKLSETIGNDPWGKAQTLRHLADTCAVVGRLADAIRRYQQDLDIRREIGDRHGEASTLDALGNAQLDHGSREDARESWHKAFSIFKELGDPQAATIQTRLDELD